MQPFGLDAVELLRVEAGLIIVAVDYQPGDDVAVRPVAGQEASLLGSDAEFIGKDALAAVAGDPPNRFKTVVVQGDTVPEYGAEVYRGDEVVGTLHQPGRVARSSGSIGLAVLRTDQAANGTVLEVAVEGGRVEGDRHRPVHPRPGEGARPAADAAVCADGRGRTAWELSRRC